VRRAPATALLAFAALWAGCKDLPDIAPGVCGNHVLEAGEECDSADPSCAPAGTIDACHTHCVADGGACPTGESCADTGFCRPTANVCGNGVVEPGEDCDSSEPPCRACRIGCTAAGVCPSGSFCGQGNICRRPTGTYTLTAPFGGTLADRFGLLDVNRDGFPDFVARSGSRVTVWLNDKQGGSAGVYATGEVPGELADAVVPGVSAPGLTVGSAAPLLSVIGDRGVMLLSVSNGALVPAALTSSLLPITGQQFQGTLARDPNGDGAPLYFDPKTKVFHLYQLPTDVSNGNTATLAATIDPSVAPCSYTPTTAYAQIATPPSRRSTLVLGFDAGSAFCVAEPNAAGGFDLTRLDFSAASGDSLASEPILADLDGDQRLDVLFHVLDASFKDYLFAFRGKPAGGFLAPIFVPLPYSSTINAGAQYAVADFDADGRDDLVVDDTVMLNRSAAPDGGFNADGGFEAQPVPTEVTVFAGDDNWAGDLNRDRFADLVLTSKSRGDALVCLGDGSGSRFACQVESTGLPGVQQVQIADVNGDGTNDLLLAAPPMPITVLQQPGVGVVFGRPFAPPDPAPLTLPVLHDSVQGVGALQASSRVASDVLLSLHTLANTDGVAIGRSFAPDALAFQTPVFVYDARLASDWSFGSPADLFLLSDDAVRFITAGPNGSGPHTIATFPGPFSDQLPARFFHDPEDPGGAGAPAVMGSTRSGGLFIARFHGATLQGGGGYDIVSTGAPAGGVTSTVLLEQDIDSDGRSEVLLGNLDGDTCSLVIARLGARQDPPTTGTTVVQKCTGTFFLADSPPFDDRLDLYIQLKVGNGMRYARFRGLPDDTFDQSSLEYDPPLIVPSAGQPAIAFDERFSWWGTQDVNGDGIPDLLLSTQAGGVIALADVVLR
jgi:hypothetical protein